MLWITDLVLSARLGVRRTFQMFRAIKYEQRENEWTSGREVFDCEYQAVKCSAGRLDYWTRCIGVTVSKQSITSLQTIMGKLHDKLKVRQNYMVEENSIHGWENYLTTHASLQHSQQLSRGTCGRSNPLTRLHSLLLSPCRRGVMDGASTCRDRGPLLVPTYQQRRCFLRVDRRGENQLFLAPEGEVVLLDGPPRCNTEASLQALGHLRGAASIVAQQEKGLRWLSSWTAHLPSRRIGFNPRPDHYGFSHVGIVPDDAAGRRVFSGIFRFPCPYTFALLHSQFSPHFTLIGALRRASAQPGAPDTHHLVDTSPPYPPTCATDVEISSLDGGSPGGCFIGYKYGSRHGIVRSVASEGREPARKESLRTESRTRRCCEDSADREVKY
ncbi:hypothetical protein PR048_001466 [Dryococelus australis]|uniref:Uncharacterized protein n=1 Tax=Dryococelus australis TaxID=614101 RepID=A0ABQ9IIU7_9NEOP|nr:hypothetical protein PR048_001466 [Dryococelus australis]